MIATVQLLDGIECIVDSPGIDYIRCPLMAGTTEPKFAVFTIILLW